MYSNERPLTLLHTIFKSYVLWCNGIILLSPTIICKAVTIQITGKQTKKQDLVRSQPTEQGRTDDSVFARADTSAAIDVRCYFALQQIIPLSYQKIITMQLLFSNTVSSESWFNDADLLRSRLLELQSFRSTRMVQTSKKKRSLIAEWFYLQYLRLGFIFCD